MTDILQQIIDIKREMDKYPPPMIRIEVSVKLHQRLLRESNQSWPGDPFLFGAFSGTPVEVKPDWTGMKWRPVYPITEIAQ